MPGLEGTTLGHYRLQGRLGHGGMSEVYLAHDERMDRDVAVKIVNSSHADYIERFRREVSAIGQLNHRHILPAYDYGEEEMWHYLVMPYMAHGTLREHLMKQDMSLEEAAEILDQVADALQSAHDNGIIHRDIKPSNILMRTDHYAYLADFGLAKALEGGGELTQTGTLLGTPEYMAPELADGPATTSSDVYALGILLYQMVTGRVPFTAETPIAVYWKQLRDQPVPPSEINPEITPAIDLVVIRALEKDPLVRYQTATELAHAYRQALETGMIEMPPLHELAPPIAESMPPITPRVEIEEIQQQKFQDGKLILPPDPIAAPSAIPYAESRGRALSGSSPSLRVRTKTPPQPVLSSTAYATTVPRAVPLRRRRRRRVNRVLVATTMALLMLFIVALIIALVYYISGKTPAGSTGTNQTAQTQVAAGSTPQGPSVTTTVGPITTQPATTTTNGALLLQDNLSNNANGRWQEIPNTCVFSGGTYHVLVKQTDFLQTCQSTSLAYDNVTFQVDVYLLSGNTAGLTFRSNGSQGYDFEITGQGNFFLRRYDSSTQFMDIIPLKKSKAILQGGQKNTLTVTADGSDLKLYINGTFVGEQQDSTYSNGGLGFVAGTLAPTPAGEAAFAHLQVSKI
ncbi:MAG: protein kinase [Chloroflexota bacterium]|nr:protein kinase [Chloroflexota bacterium]